MDGLQQLLAQLQQMGNVNIDMSAISDMFPNLYQPSILDMGAPRGNTQLIMSEPASMTPVPNTSPLLSNKTPWSKIVGGAAAGAGMIGGLATLFGGGGDSFSRGDIDSIIRSLRQSGTRQIGHQLSQSNVATAGNLASRGLGSSTITTGALGANQSAAMDALANLESQLGMTRGQLEQFLAQLEEQRRSEKLGAFSNIADIGSMLLFL